MGMMSHSYFEQKTKITRETFSEINFILKFLVCEIREENRILVDCVQLTRYVVVLVIPDRQ